MLLFPDDTVGRAHTAHDKLRPAVARGDADACEVVALRFDGFDGGIDVLGGDWQNAVYRVSLGDGDGPGGAQPLVMDRAGEPRAGKPPASDTPKVVRPSLILTGSLATTRISGYRRGKETPLSPVG